jgi:hypothetical protein
MVLFSSTLLPCPAILRAGNKKAARRGRRLGKRKVGSMSAKEEGRKAEAYVLLPDGQSLGLKALSAISIVEGATPRVLITTPAGESIEIVARLRDNWPEGSGPIDLSFTHRERIPTENGKPASVEGVAYLMDGEAIQASDLLSGAFNLLPRTQWKFVRTNNGFVAAGIFVTEGYLGWVKFKESDLPNGFIGKGDFERILASPLDGRAV